MAKTAVCSWRVEPELIAELERRARERGESVAGLLDSIAAAWLRERAAADLEGDPRQDRIRKRAAACFGTVAGGDVHRADTARNAVR